MDPNVCSVAGFWVGVAGLVVGIAGLIISIILIVKADEIETALDNKVLQLITIEFLPEELAKLKEVREYFKSNDPVYLSQAVDELSESISMIKTLEKQLSKRNERVFSEIKEIEKNVIPVLQDEFTPFIISVKPHLNNLISELTIEVSKNEKR